MQVLERSLVMHRIISQEIKTEVLAKAGVKVLELASQYGISIKTIYTWLRLDSMDPVVSILKYNKLKRENEELKRLVGEITLEMSLGKKVELVRLGVFKSIGAEALGIERKNIYREGKQEIKDLALKETINEVHRHHPIWTQMVYICYRVRTTLYLCVMYTNFIRIISTNKPDKISITPISS